MAAPDYDVILIGARVAGSVLASILAEGGARVLLLDRARFPSDTLSTHFFRAPALRAFRRIGVVDEVLAAAPAMTVEHNVVDGIAFPEPVDGPDDYPFHLCLRRLPLDEILTRRAGSLPGVELRQGARVERLLSSNGAFGGAAWREADGSGEATARAVVGADGLNSFVARTVQAASEHDEPVHRAMYYAYYRGLPWMPGPAAEFHYLGNTLVYCFACDAELTLLAASVPIDRFGEFRKGPERALLDVVSGMEGLAPRLAGAERVGPVRGTGSIPGRLRVPYGPGWALVGDAGMVMDPWSGQGIDQAATHAVMLGEELGRYLAERAGWEEAMESYHRRRNEFSRKAFERTCRQAVDFRPMTQAALVRRGLA